MTWVDSIQELDIYSRGASDHCYCDLIIQPSDLTLQGVLGSNSIFGDLKIYLYTTDGMAAIADLTSYFDWYIAKADGRSFFVARLKYFPQILCDNRCFILHAEVTTDGFEIEGARTSFSKYTQQYCLADCCVVAENVTISGGGVIQLSSTVLPVTVTSVINPMCRPLLRMEVAFDCTDQFTNDFWGVPASNSFIAGSVGASGMFAYTKVLNITGSVVPQPWNIKRTISLNSKVQRTESTPTYDVQSYEEFPLWKMREISGMLHATYLAFNGVSYVFAGGQPFEFINKKRPCKQYYRLKLEVQDRTRYQSFGCGASCNSENVKYYAFQRNFARYFDDAGRPIGSFNDVLNWFNTGGGGQYGAGEIQTTPGGGVAALDPNRPVWTATAFDPPPPPITVPYFGIVKVEGENLPAYIYGDTTRPAGRIYAQDLINEDYNALFGVTVNHVECAKPIAGSLSYYDMVCASPVPGTPTYTDHCKLPVLGVPVYGDLDDVPISGGGPTYILLEDGSGTILGELDDLIITE